MNIDDLLRIAMERRASDLHLKVGNYPHLRIDGDLVPLTDQARVSAEDMLNMAFSMMSGPAKAKIQRDHGNRHGLCVAGLGRFRVNVFQQRGNVGLVLRVIPTKIRALDELFLPKVVEQICGHAARSGAGDGSDGLGQIDDAGGHGGPHQLDSPPSTLSPSKTPSNFCIATKRDT